MKNLLLLLLIFTLTSIFAQNNRCSVIKYKQIFNFGTLVESDWNLYATKVSSLYLEQDIKKTSSKTLKSKGDSGSSKMYNPGRKVIIPQFFLHKENQFYFRQVFYNNTLLVKEKNKDIQFDWVISDEEKNIGKIVCTKATTSFRGRNYIAWFANSIPLPYGPWKMSGLPGLILELYDEENEVYFVATRIELNKLTNCDETIDDIYIADALTIENYINERENILDQFFAKLSARQPAGSKPIVRDKNCTDCGGKLEYFK